jgi:hypothetical protein
LVYQNCREDESVSTESRRNVEKMRQARRPTTIYGANVNRRLRGRWFSLVPVRRRAMAAASAAILGIAVALCLLHWAAVAWQPLAYRAELARPFRLDRPDSLGTWVRAAYLAAAAGTSLLVYQLRRYRNDDFRGSYRIWPPVIVLIAILSVDSICSLVPWGGELIDLILGRRVALAGGDWIRIGLTVGGAALSLRLLAEVRHSKLAMAMMAVAIVFFAIPMAGRWGVVGVDTPGRWLVITSSPLLAAAALWVACGAYLRKLFREVRKLDEDDSVSLRVRQWQEHWKERFEALRAGRRKTGMAGQDGDEASDKTLVEPKRKGIVKPASPLKTKTAPAAARTDVKPIDEPPTVRKRWFTFRFWSKKTAGDLVPPGETETQAVSKPIETPRPTADSPSPTVPKSQASAAVSKTKPVEPGTPADDEGVPAKTGRKWFSGWFAKKDKPSDAEAGADATLKAKAKQKPVDGEGDDADPGDDPSIDWASMGKAERRRLRREMKRGDQAA